MADDDLHASVAPLQRYYLCVDGTGTDDSVEYGRLLQQKFAFRNLLSEFLQTDPKGDTRLVDPGHPFLSIRTFPRPGIAKPIAIVCPGGLNGLGLDDFWQTYEGEEPEETANKDGRHVFTPDVNVRIETFGRHTAASKSALFMRDLIRVPAIEKVTDKQGKAIAQLKDGTLSGSQNPTDDDVAAEFLVVSSHGWLGGYMHGDPLKASPAAKPVQAQKEFQIPFVYFLAGEAVAKQQFFVGPRWIILAQCSTLNLATWLAWAKLMAASIPPVRGILGYEEVSPGVIGSIQIAQTFFSALESGQTFLKAWRSANKNEKWAALLHKSALKDTMKGWTTLDKDHPIGAVQLEREATSYLAFGASLERGKERPNDGKGLIDIPAQNVLNAPPPFGLKIETADPDPDAPRPFEEVTEDTLNRRRAKLLPDVQVRMTITPPANATIASATVRWVHMRETHTVQPKVTGIFKSFTPVPADSLQLTVSTKDPRTPNTVVVQPTAGPVSSLVILWVVESVETLLASGLEPAHSLIWPLITINVVGGPKSKETFPFSTKGLLF